jgi:hypothetical protein
MKAYTLRVSVSALCLTLTLACANCGTKNNNTTIASGKCAPVETVVPTPDGGSLVSGVSIIRDGNGNLTTKWKTTLPAGTKAMIDIGFWRPDKKKDIDYGPLMDGAGMEDTADDGSIIVNRKLFTNEGKAYNQGQYYANLTVIDNSIWQQPMATKAALAAVKGRLKTVKIDALGVMFDLAARFELPACADLAATAAPTPMPTMTKGQAEAIARKLIAQTIEAKMAKAGQPVTITVSGEDNTTITIKSPNFTRETVMSQAANEEFVAPFRKNKFKRLVFTDGVDTWGINLK